MTTEEPDQQEAHKRRAGRPRSAQSHQAILEATRELIAEEGIRGISIEAIAARAGVGKTTIYRHWESKADLIVEALNEYYREAPINDTGNFRNDMIGLFKKAVELREAQPLLVSVGYQAFAEVQTDPAFMRTLYQKIFEPRIQHLIEYITRAQASGKLNPNLDPLSILFLMGGPVGYVFILSRLLPNYRVTDELIEQTVDAVLNGIAIPPSESRSVTQEPRTT